MPRSPRRLPAQNTLSYLLLTLTALCGEYPISQISRLPGGPAYLESMVTSLRQSGLDVYKRQAPDGEHQKVFSADGVQWYKQYAADTVIKTPFTAPDGEIDYHKEIVKKMPDPPKRKDRM